MPSTFPRTFSNEDPIRHYNCPLPSTQVWRVRDPRRALEALVVTTNSCSTPADDYIEIPKQLESLDTLGWLGLNQSRAADFWQRWQDTVTDLDPEILPYEFGLFARLCLKNMVSHERCDTQDPGVDWEPNLRRIGVDEQLIEAIGTCAPELKGVRNTRSAATWVDQAMEWRWNYLEYLQNASDKRAEGRVSLPVESSTRPFPAQDQDVTVYKYDRDNVRVVDTEGNSPDFIPIWRWTTRLNAECLWRQDLRNGNFDIYRQAETSPTDFGDRRSVQCWAPDLEAAQLFARFAKGLAEPSGLCLIRIEVPRELITEGERLILRSTDENWKRVVYNCRQSRKIKPDELRRKVFDSPFLIGDVASGVDFLRLKNWQDIDERCCLKRSDGTPVTQFVFGHGNERGGPGRTSECVGEQDFGTECGVS